MGPAITTLWKLPLVVVLVLYYICSYLTEPQYIGCDTLIKKTAKNLGANMSSLDGWKVVIRWNPKQFSSAEIAWGFRICQVPSDNLQGLLGFWHWISLYLNRGHVNSIQFCDKNSGDPPRVTLKPQGLLFVSMWWNCLVQWVLSIRKFTILTEFPKCRANPYTVFSRLEAPCACASQDLITGTDRADSEFSNGGFGLKIGH